MKLEVSILFYLLHFAQNARILGVFNFAGRSHYILGSTLMKALAEKGHNVTIITPFKEKDPPKTYREILIEELAFELEKFMMTIDQYQETNQSILSIITKMTTRLAMVQEKTLLHPNVQNLLNSQNETFDLVIMEQFFNDAFQAFAHHFKAHSVVLSTVGRNLWVNELVGNPSPLSYVPNIILNYSSNMTFKERLVNTIVETLTRMWFYIGVYPKQNEIMKKYFPNPPNHIYDILFNTSLVLLNSHGSINPSIPIVPNMIEIGGYHVKPPKPLPDTLQKFLDNATDGVVYFSMGSNLKSARMAEGKRKIFINTFSKLKQKVLWKWEEDELPGKPPNVQLGKWLPQQDILAHPNVKLFITHGGLLSTIEAVYHGTPILAIPIYGDQKMNAANAVLAGYGLSLPYTSLSEASLIKNVNELLNNPKYTENIKTRSQLMHDRPVKPLDNAIYWIEFVIRNKGAPHLRVSGLDLPFYQYFLLDVIAVLALAVFSVIFIFYIILKKILCYIKSKKNQKVKKS